MLTIIEASHNEQVHLVGKVVYDASELLRVIHDVEYYDMDEYVTWLLVSDIDSENIEVITYTQVASNQHIIKVVAMSVLE